MKKHYLTYYSFGYRGGRIVKAEISTKQYKKLEKKYPDKLGLQTFKGDVCAWKIESEVE